MGENGIIIMKKFRAVLSGRTKSGRNSLNSALPIIIISIIIIISGSIGKGGGKFPFFFVRSEPPFALSSTSTDRIGS